MKFDPIVPTTHAPPSAVWGGAEYPMDPDLFLSFRVPYPYADEEEPPFIDLATQRDGKVLVPRACAPIGSKPGKVGLPMTSYAELSSEFVPRNDEQDRVVKECFNLLAGGDSFICRAPTGFGKTVVGTQVAYLLQRQTVILVPKWDLAEQWAKTVKMLLGIDVGIIKGDKVDTGHPIVLASIQSVCKEGRYPPEVFETFGLCIVDEVHRLGAPEFVGSMWNIPARLRLGLSATPWRSDGKDFVFKAHIGETLVASNASTMPFRVFVAGSGWQCPRKDDGEQIPHAPGKTMHVTKMIAKHARRNRMLAYFTRRAYEKGRTILVMADLVDHLKLLRGLAVKAGIPIGDTSLYIGGLSKKQRAEALTKRVIFASFKYAAEGTDIPHADTLVLGSGRANVIQIVGRILRESPGKRTPVVFDMIDGDSWVFHKYAQKRLEWYASESAEVVKLKRAHLGEKQ